MSRGACSLPLWGQKHKTSQSQGEEEQPSVLSTNPAPLPVYIQPGPGSIQMGSQL